jgi:hypothetical protein
VVLIALGLLGCQRELPERTRPAPASTRIPYTVHIPAKLSSIESGHHDSLGNPIRVSCQSCHSQRVSKPLPSVAAELREFHVGLTLQHGTLACTSCHQQGDAMALHLASGERIPIADALRLCAQCHGSQYRDYQRLAHGGASGYWNRALGPSVRNHCVDCHDPHAPRYPGTMPVLAPRDRIPPARKDSTHG